MARCWLPWKQPKILTGQYNNLSLIEYFHLNKIGYKCAIIHGTLLGRELWAMSLYARIVVQKCVHVHVYISLLPLKKKCKFCHRMIYFEIKNISVRMIYKL